LGALKPVGPSVMKCKCARAGWFMALRANSTMRVVAARRENRG
jgi:hypothetical protein